METRAVDGFTQIGVGHGVQEFTIERGTPSLCWLCECVRVLQGLD
ncbi:hypothetical protein ACWDAO_37470 [Streptomyces sp. NPDC001212]